MKYQAVLYVLAIFLFSGTAHSAEAKDKTKASTVKEEKLYKLLGTAPKGRKFRPIEATSPIPFNKKYDQLNDEQVKIFRSYFENLTKDDTPPYPKKGLIEIYNPLIKGHKRIGGVGELLVFTEVNEKGGVNNVTVYKSPTKQLADLVTTVMFNTKFKPATCNGEPCTMDYPFYYDVPRRNRDLQTLDKENFGKGDIDTNYSG